MLVLCPTGAATIEADERGFSPPPRRPAGTPSTPAKRQATAGADSGSGTREPPPPSSAVLWAVAKLCLPSGCACAGAALPGDKLECVACTNDTRTAGVSAATGCDECKGEIAQRAEDMYAADVDPSKPSRAEWLLRKLDGAVHAPINPSSAHAKPLTFSAAVWTEYPKLMAEARFEEFDTWLLLDFE